MLALGFHMFIRKALSENNDPFDKYGINAKSYGLSIMLVVGGLVLILKELLN